MIPARRSVLRHLSPRCCCCTISSVAAIFTSIFVVLSVHTAADFSLVALHPRRASIVRCVVLSVLRAAGRLNPYSSRSPAESVQCAAHVAGHRCTRYHPSRAGAAIYSSILGSAPRQAAMLRPATPLTIVLLISFVLLLLSTLSSPIIPSIPIATFQGIHFGVFGYCTPDDGCIGIRVGYTTGLSICLPAQPVILT